MEKAYHFTIDPGATGSGWAVWTKEWQLISHGVVTPPAELSWEEKAYWTVDQLNFVAEESGGLIGYVEYPAFFESYNASGVAKSGALVKLAWFVGLVCGRLPFKVKLVTVGEWKGQLPKEVVIKRIKRILPNVKGRSHDWDAIGIGLFLKGDLK